MINVSDIVSDPDFNEPLVIMRSSGGQFGLGGFTDTPVPIKTYGIATPAKPEELQQVPEGSRVSGMMTFRSVTPFFLSNESTATNADIVVWRGLNYRIIYVFPWDHFGCPKGLGTLMPGNQGVTQP